jgi:CDP-diacylglycerol--glycerol-3-phosphate 3-phosphatidyltransferase
MNLPNKLTLARCAMAVLFVALMSVQHLATYFAAYLVFIAAAITDYYDGKIARQYNLVTNFGKLMDPLADKILMVAAFLMMMQIPELRIPAWAIILILARELLVTGARSLAANDGEVIAAMKSGKTKTLLQMIYVFTFLFFALVFEFLQTFEPVARMIPGGAPLFIHAIGLLSMVAIIGVAIYTVYSGVDFARTNWKALRLDDIR